MIGKRLFLVAALAWSAYLGGFGLPRAEADPILESATIYDSTMQPWTVETSDPRVGPFIRTPATGTNQTTMLEIDETWDLFNDLTPIVITFFENNPATMDVGGGPSPLGLNFVLRKVAVNATAVPWVGFTEFLTDDDIPTAVPQTDGTHPSNAHFHPQNGMQQVFSPPGWGFINPAPDTTQVTVGGPPITRGIVDFQVSTHDVLVQGFQRQFFLVEDPIPAPEPSSLILVGIGSLALLGYGWVRRTCMLRVI